MISMRCPGPGDLLSWQVRDHLIARDVITMSVVTPLTMIRMIGGRCRFGQGIADVLRNRLARTVISAIPHPAGQLRHRCALGIVGDRGGLRHRIRVNLEHSRATRQHRLGDILRHRPMNPRHLKNGSRSVVGHSPAQFVSIAIQ